MNVTIFADASYCNRQKVGGYGFWIACERGRQSGGGRLRSPVIETSTVAEMMALVNALHYAIVKKLVLDTDIVLLQTDCMAAIDTFEGKRTRLNAQEKEVQSAMALLAQKGRLQLKYRHVKGHTNGDDKRSITNRLCDERAKRGLKVARNAQVITTLRNKLEDKPNGHQ